MKGRAHVEISWLACRLQELNTTRNWRCGRSKWGQDGAKMGQNGATTKLVLKAPNVTKLTKLVEKPSYAQSTVTRTGAGGFILGL